MSDTRNNFPFSKREKEVVIKDILVILIFITVIAITIISVKYAGHSSVSSAKTSESVGFERELVTRVIDGDTFEIATGNRVRLICIDAPEMGAQGANESRAYLSSLILNKTVLLEKDTSNADGYARLLRYVYIINQNNSNEYIFVNKELVSTKHAVVYRVSPDTKFCDMIEGKV